MEVYKNRNRVLERFGRSYPRDRYPLVENFEAQFPARSNNTPVLPPIYPSSRANFNKRTLRLSPIRDTPRPVAHFNNSRVLPPIQPKSRANLQSVNSPFSTDTGVQYSPPSSAGSGRSIRENFLPMHKGKRYSDMTHRPPFDSHANRNGYIKSPVRKPYVPDMTPRPPIVRSPISRRSRSPSPNSVKEAYRFMPRF